VYITDLRRAGLKGRKEEVLAEAAWLDAQGELIPQVGSSEMMQS
jgi:hypothetical protein